MCASLSCAIDTAACTGCGPCDNDGVFEVGEDGVTCSDLPAPPIDYCCGDLVCEGDESSASCELDCGAGCPLGQSGDPCADNADCCSGNCKGKPGAKTCK